MNKPQRLKPGDKVAIVSLSRGILGESFAAHEIVLGEKRLAEFGLIPQYMPNAKKGIEYLHDHPEARAADLKQAFLDPSIKGIFCAIGGDDTINTVPYLLDDPEFFGVFRQHQQSLNVLHSWLTNILRPSIFDGFC
jgi:muramoyltetrapeptide carboxypeptidase LdcA involved in peptidoglycan recycling